MRRMRRALLLWLPAAVLAALASAAPPTRVAIIEAEAARASRPGQLDLLVEAATTPSALQFVAIRALGRLGRVGLVDTLLPLLDANEPAARAEAAWALAQSVGADLPSARAVREALLRRIVGEDDADVRGAIGEALGRLPLDGSQAASDEGIVRGGTAAGPEDRVEQALVASVSRVQVSRRVETQAAGGRIVGLTLTQKREALVPMPALLGGLRGLEAMARSKARLRRAFLPGTIDRLRVLATDDAATSAEKNRSGSRQADAARARRLALLCLLPVGGVSAPLAARLSDDPDPQVRRLAVSAAAADRATIDRGLKDRFWLVRYEALRAFGRRFQSAEGCAPILAGIGPDTDHQALLAVDLLGNGCRPEDRAVERLIDLSAGVSTMGTKGSPGAPPADWRRPAHAIVALATAAPDRARPYIARFVESDRWQSRMYGARAAAKAGDADLLRRFAAGPNDNVREAAIAGLTKVVGHQADEVYVAALAARDFQLVMTAASALAGTPDKATAVPALLAALARLSALDSDPSRDPRVAVLQRLEELGSREQAEALRPHLADVDPTVAELAAKILSAWTGTTVAAKPAPRPRQLPALSEELLQRLAKTTLRVTMSGGGQFDVKPLVDLAPVSSALFVERAARGFYTNLTFHRVLPNFLLQGGSPGANEYMGDTRYMIDEPGRTSQTRGTVGTSTRGRDTGDGQIYVNLVDTPRLDHEYSIFAEVVRGMDVVDRVLEGDVMTKVEVLVK